MNWALIAQLAGENASAQELDIAKVMLDALSGNEVSIPKHKLQALLLNNSCKWAESEHNLLDVLQTFADATTLAQPKLINRLFKFQDDVLYWYKWFQYFAEILCHFERIHISKVTKIQPNSPDGLILNAQQKEALYLMLNADAGVVTGAPGMGKSTVIKQAVRMSEEQQILVCAPSASAVLLLENELVNAQNAKQISFQTIHRALGIGYHGEAKFDEFNQLPYDWVIVDEVSMVGSELMYQLISALAPACRLTIVGDQNQLGSVNPGDFFGELVDRLTLANNSNLVALNEHIRLKSELVAITENLLSELHSDASISFDDSQFKHQLLESKSIHWHRIEQWPEPSELANIILEQWQTLTQRDSKEFLQLTLPELPLIISSRRHGMIGSEKLNLEIYNLKLQYQCIQRRESLDSVRKNLIADTPIILNKNDSFQSLYNSQFGSVSTDNTVIINNRKIRIGLLPDFSLGWVITVHKSQGKENDLVFVIIDESELKMINKHLIYTAITRTKNKIVVIAKDLAFQHLFSN